MLKKKVFMKCRHVTHNCLPGRRFISALDNPKIQVKVQGR